MTRKRIGIKIGMYTANITLVKNATININAKTDGTVNDLILASMAISGSTDGSATLFFGLVIYTHIK